MLGLLPFRHDHALCDKELVKDVLLVNLQQRRQLALQYT